MRGGETQIPQCEPARQADSRQADRQADSRQADRQAGETISETGGKFLLCKRFARVCQGLPGFIRRLIRVCQDLSGFAMRDFLSCRIFIKRKNTGRA